MKEIIVNVDNYNENSIKTIEGDNLSEVYKIYICKNKRRIDLTNKIAVMAYVDEYGSKRSNILNLNITNAAEGEIELPITNIISEHNGVYACQVAIYGENNSLEQTAPFSLIVENNIFSKISNAAINSTDFHILSEAIKTTNAYGEKLKEGTENIELQYASKLNSKADETDLIVERKRIDSLVSIPEGTPNSAELIDGRIGVDGVTYNNIGDAIRTQIKDNIPIDFQLKYNLTQNGYIVYNTGNVASNNEDYYYSDYIELLAFDEITIRNLNYMANDLGGLAFYNENKEFISGYQYNNNTHVTLEVPENAKYMRFTVASKYTKLDNVKVCQSINSTKINTKKSIKDIEININTANDKLDTLLHDIKLEKRLKGVYITPTGATSDTGGSGWSISQPVSVTKSSIITIHARGYKSNVAIVSKYNGNDEVFTPLVLSVDDKTKYTFIPDEDMQICICSNTYDWKLFIKDDTLPDSYELIKNSISIPYVITDTSSYIVYSTGQVATGASKLSCSDFINVRGIEFLTIYNLNYKANDYAGLAFYNEDKEYISGHQYNRDTHLTLEVPENAKYMRFTVVSKDTLLFTNVIKYIVNSKINKYFHRPICTRGKYINYTNGVETRHDNQDLGVTNFIKIEPNVTTLEINNLNYKSNDFGGLAFYNEDKEFISGYQYNNNTHVTLDIPKNAKYVRATILMTSLDILTIITKSTINDGLTKLSEKIDDIDNKQTKLEDSIFDYCQIFHRISGVGDSLMSGELAYYDEEQGRNVYIDCYKYSWLSNLCKNIGATATHYSSGGRTTKTWLQEYLTKLKTEDPKPSAYYIGLGTNDLSYVTLGAIEDCGTDKETFYGMYSKIITEIQAFNPNAKIFCCSLYYKPENDTVQTYCKAIKDISEKYKCYYLDFVNRFGNEYKSNNMVSLGHFTAPGYVRVAKQMQQLTNEIIRDNIKDFNFLGVRYKDI
ncbi:SGNH/GDSL hydrolase family protein [Clostridium perfringens]|nr:SGNH/GDSL hydrolase family protein [Clostridium perfringens]